MFCNDPQTTIFVVDFCGKQKCNLGISLRVKNPSRVANAWLKIELSLLSIRKNPLRLWYFADHARKQKCNQKVQS